MDMSGNEFRLKRKQIGLTQRELADVFECSRQHIVMIEQAHTVPAVYALAMDTFHKLKLAEYASA